MPIEDWNDNIKLQKMRHPEPSNHPDPRMHLELADMAKPFETGSYSISSPKRPIRFIKDFGEKLKDPNYGG